jgi:hypothetical protein
MITQITTLEELKQMFVELLLDKTDKVTKVTDGSVLNGFAFGTAKLGQKVLKDVAIIESHIFPDSAAGIYLDNVARLNGTSPRYGASKSSTYVRVVGAPGTTYVAGTTIFSSTQGQNFDVLQNYVIGAQGFGYVKVRSQNTGSITKVDPLTINRVNPVPVGHQYCINEFGAFGGKDAEDDTIFRRRIKDSPNILARNTLSYLEQIFNKIENSVLKVYYHGVNDQGQIVLAILTENGVDLTTPELNNILLQGEKFFGLNELKPDGFNGYGISLTNISWQPVDISFRVELFTSYNPDEIRKEIQIRFNKYIDYRTWEYNKRVEWDDLLQLVKTTPGVKYVLDNYFTPNNDVNVDVNKLPRIRGFLMLDPDGNLISDGANNLNPIFYPENPDFNFQSSVLSTII